MNHSCVCRAWRPVSLERRVLVIEGNQHIALASASGKREVHFGPMCINRLVGRFTACWDQAINMFADSCVKGRGLHRNLL
ncbi:hypothetical protein TNCV_1920411 [Trichonephila clavipes]|nr:hypothetical protein TNCV_1920411 [Trichonephila clavipes]